MWNRIVAFLRALPIVKEVAIHVVIVVGFLLAVWAASSTIKSGALRFAEGWRAELNPITCTKDPGVIDLPSNPNPNVAKPAQTSTDGATGNGAPAPPNAEPAPISEATKKAFEARLAGQFHEVQQRIHHHFDQMITYYAYSFSTTFMVGILAAIAAIALLFITMNGWEDANQYQKTIFLLATVTATYSAAFPGIFQLQKNVDDNRFLYLKYVGLANEMCSYQVTNETTDKTQLDEAGFIHQVDNEMITLNKIAVGFDISQIPDFTKALNQATGKTGNNAPNPGQQGVKPRPRGKTGQ